MTNQLFLLTLILISFSSCSEEFVDDQIADYYTHAYMSCHDLDVDEEYENIQVSDLPNGRFEINFRNDLGIINGNISDTEITIDAYKGTTTSGIELEYPGGSGNFTLEDGGGSLYKNIHFKLRKNVNDNKNMCTVSITKIGN